MVDGAPSGVGEGVFFRRHLVRRLVLGGEQERTPGRRESPVLHLCAFRARQEVATVEDSKKGRSPEGLDPSNPRHLRLRG